MSKDFVDWNLYVDINEMNYLTRYELFNRLTRNGIHCIIPIDNNMIAVIIKKKILVFEKGKLFYSLPLPRGNRPLRKAVDVIGRSVFFADYWGNSKREPVNIYRLDVDKKELKAIHTFYDIRHVHFLQKDVLNPSNLIIGTGDEDKECKILIINISSRKTNVLGEGSQDWRAVSVIQKGNFLYWGSDCPYDKNYIFQFNRDSKELKKICKIDGPAYYSTFNKKGQMFIATTVEDKKLHKAKLYCSEDGLKWDVIKEWKKDIYSVKLFGYGVVEFIWGQELLDELHLNLQGLK